MYATISSDLTVSMLGFSVLHPWGENLGSQPWGSDVAAGAAPRTPRDLKLLLDVVRKPVVKVPLAPALKGAAVIKLQLGLAARRSLPPTMPADSQRSPNLIRARFAFLHRHYPEATASSITIAWHKSAPLHTDGSNVAGTYLLSLGAKAFPAQSPDATLAFEGHRCYVSFYTHQATVRLDPATRATLRRLGVRRRGQPRSPVLVAPGFGCRFANSADVSANSGKGVQEMAEYWQM